MPWGPLEVIGPRYGAPRRTTQESGHDCIGLSWPPQAAWAQGAPARAPALSLRDLRRRQSFSPLVSTLTQVGPGGGVLRDMNRLSCFASSAPVANTATT